MKVGDFIQQQPFSLNGFGAASQPLQNPLGADSELAPSGEASFASTLNGFVDNVNTMQKDSAKLGEKLIKGEAVDMHDVMISAEKAKTSFQLLMELRNKGLDLYREVMRMQA